MQSDDERPIRRSVPVDGRSVHHDEARAQNRRNKRIMAQSDRQRLLERALALPQAEPSDFFGDRRPPDNAKPELLKRINDTSLRTKLLEVRLAEGLQSPKGPQKIASIVRIYPAFDAPERGSSNGRRASVRSAPSAAKQRNAPQQRGLPSVEEMERLIRRIRDVEREVETEMGAQLEGTIAELKRKIADAHDHDLEATVRELSDALETRRRLASQIRYEALAKIEGDSTFEERVFIRLIRRST